MFFETLLQRVMRRPVKFDPRTPPGYLVLRGVTTFTGLCRGLLLTRRRIVLGRGARVWAPSLLRIDGGLVRIDDYCFVDCLGVEGLRLGRNFKLGAHSRIAVSGSLADLGRGITIGDNVGIGEFAHIGGAGGVTIGADTIVGAYFSVHPENHIFDDPDTPIRAQGVTRAGIAIGEGCWIGAKVTVTDGVTIGKNCVIAAGSVVTKSFPDHSLIGGVPARLIRDLSSKHESA